MAVTCEQWTASWHRSPACRCRRSADSGDLHPQANVLRPRLTPNVTARGGIGDEAELPDEHPAARPVFVWLEIAAQLAVHGDGSLSVAIPQAMDGRRLGDTATFALTVDEQRHAPGLARRDRS